MSLILGLNAYHADSSACILRDGRLLAAAEEERFRRIKHWAGFPSEAIAYCLKEAGAQLKDVTEVAINSDPRAHFGRKLAYALARRPDPSLIIDRLRNAAKRRALHDEFSQAFPNQAFHAKVRRVEHHLAHLASCFHVSPFEHAAVASVDGFGDFSSAAWGVGHGQDLRVDERVYFPHSLGVFYQAITQYLGFPNYGDEYKVMGLASYGEPRYQREMERIVRLLRDGAFALNLEFFRHDREKVPYAWSGGSPSVGKLYSSALIDLLGPQRQPAEPLDQRHKDIARSAQVAYEEAFFWMLNALHKRYRLPDLVVAGGCGMNSVANGKIALRTPFSNIYVPPSAGDAGGAIGAALIAGQSSGAAPPRGQMNHASWGPSYSAGEVAGLLRERGRDLEVAQCDVARIDDEGALCDRVAADIAQGLVVGWFQGRMEWGPRALGNRSIVGDPRRADMKDVLNLKIKRRESFRPFAPSVLREAVAEWFEQDADVPFMMQVFQIREDKRALIPAVTHVDGSGRLQTVRAAENPRYYRLIKSFSQQTGVPMVLNTSFNENEPVVCRPQEALDCFLRTRMDVLVLGEHVIRRAPEVSPSAGAVR